MDVEEEIGTYQIDKEVSDKIRKYFDKENYLSDLEKTIKRDNPHDIIKKYQKLVEETDKLGLNPDAIFDDVDDKLYLLKEIMEYTNLKGISKKIEDCPNAQIGLAFQHTYNSAYKALYNKR